MAKSVKVLTVLFIGLMAGLFLVRCAIVDVPMPNPIPTQPEQARQIEDAYKLVVTLKEVGSIKESEWLAVKAAYDEYRTALIALKTQHERLKAGEPVDLTEYIDHVTSSLTAFWLKQQGAVSSSITKEGE